MKTIKIPGKRVSDVLAAEKALRDAGFAIIGVVAAIGPSPYVHVHLEDGETKDPTSLITAHVDPCRIEIVSDKAIGASGVPEALANGSDKHTLTITKKDPVTGLKVSGSENLQIIPDMMIQVSPTQRKFFDGVAQLTIGPSTMSGPLAVKVVDQNGILMAGSIMLRFV